MKRDSIHPLIQILRKLFVPLCIACTVLLLHSSAALAWGMPGPRNHRAHGLKRYDCSARPGDQCPSIKIPKHNEDRLQGGSRNGDCGSRVHMGRRLSSQTS
jgi:hypothetical protein